MASVSQSFEYQLAHLDESRQTPIIVLNACLPLLATLAVSARLWARRLVKVRWEYDDYAIMVALPLSYGLSVLSLLGVHHGLGKHLLANDLADVGSYLKVLYAYDIVYTLCLPMIKMSVLLFYHRIFPTRSVTVVLCASGVFVVLWCLSALLVAIFSCRPIGYFWDKAQLGRCIDIEAFVTAEAGITIFTDVVILAIPLPLVWVLKIPCRQKLALSGIFLLGAFVCVASIIRIPTLPGVFSADSTWTGYDACQWSIVEADIGIVCACLPTLRPLARRLRPHALSLSKASWLSYSATHRSGGTVGSLSTPKVSPAAPRPSADPSAEDGELDVYSPDAADVQRRAFAPREAGRVNGPAGALDEETETEYGNGHVARPSLDVEYTARIPDEERGLPAPMPSPAERVLAEWRARVRRSLETPSHGRLPPGTVLRSPLFRFRIGASVFDLHSAVVERSSAGLGRMMAGAMSEAKHGEGVLQDITDDTFVLFAEFAYTGDYASPPGEAALIAAALAARKVGGSVEWYAKPDQAWLKFMSFSYPPGPIVSLDSSPKNTADEDDAPLLISHARLYVLADRYDVPVLEVLTLHKLHAILCAFSPPDAGRINDVVELARYAYANTPTYENGTDELRHLVSSYIAFRPGKLARSPEVLRLLEEGGSLPSDLVNKILD
ncbi:MAG: hypothetical protein M1832_002369 [Thelocarpon impressellum]|nr:MAG: hypothetical protein M1832_002369 [Thelocarpon impressellum]